MLLVSCGTMPLPLCLLGEKPLPGHRIATVLYFIWTSVVLCIEQYAVVTLLS